MGGVPEKGLLHHLNATVGSVVQDLQDSAAPWRALALQPLHTGQQRGQEQIVLCRMHG